MEEFRRIFPRIKSNSHNNKFLKLNFNLKNIIFEYCSFIDRINSFFKVHRSFISALKSRKLFVIFRTRLIPKLGSEIELSKIFMDKIKEEILKLFETKEDFYQFIIFLLIFKFKSKESFEDIKIENNNECLNLFFSFLEKTDQSNY